VLPDTTEKGGEVSFDSKTKKWWKDVLRGEMALWPPERVFIPKWGELHGKAR